MTFGEANPRDSADIAYSMSYGPQDSLTNRNKLIAECSDLPARRACMNWLALASDGMTKKKVPHPQTPPWRRVLLDPVPRPMGTAVVACVDEGGPLSPSPREKHVEECNAENQTGHDGVGG